MLVGADRAPRPNHISFLGSIKWRDRAPFDDTDAATLMRHRNQLPGADDGCLLVGVSRTGFDTDRLDIQLGPEQILAAFGAR